MDHKNCLNAQVKLLDGSNGRIQLYLSTFGNWDNVRPVPERPVKGAFAPFLADFKRDGFITLAHDWARLPVASITEADEDEYGLLVEAEFHSTSDAQNARQVTAERVARGKTVKSSMGYQVLDKRFVPMDDPILEAQGITKGLELVSVPLFEGSLVNVPANPRADVFDVKSLLTGLPFETHSAMALVALQEWLDRFAEIKDLRGKAGRVLSGSNTARLEAMHAHAESICSALEEMLGLPAEPEIPEEKTFPPPPAIDVAAEYRRFLALEARLNGVLLA